MALSKSATWAIAYAAFSISSFGAILVHLASTATDYLSLMHELTGGYSLAILVNFLMFCFMLFGYLCILVVFGEIRIIEFEHIMDQLPLYSFTLLFIFVSDEKALLNLIWTGFAILLKAFHIILFDRVDFLEVKVVHALSNGPVSRAFVIKKFALNLHVALTLVLLVCDFLMAKILAYDVFQGVSSMGSLLFGVQFGVMGIETFTFLGKLALNVYEYALYRSITIKPPVGDSATRTAQESDTPELLDDDDDDDDDDDGVIWENKSLFMQSFEIVSASFKVAFYLIFLYTVLIHSKSSPSIIQGCIVASHQLYKQIIRFRSYLHQAKRLDEHLSDATEDDLAAADHMCIICRDNMYSPEQYVRAKGKALQSRKHPKKLFCGHILHLACLKNWLERSDSCPLCRKKVFNRTQEPIPDATPQGEPLVPRIDPQIDRLFHQFDNLPGDTLQPNDPPQTATPMYVHPDIPTGELDTTEAPDSAELLRPTSTTRAGGDLGPTNVSGQTENVSGQTNSSGQTENSSGQTENSSDSRDSRVSTRRRRDFFIPKGWIALPIGKTSSSNVFLLELSSSASGSLRIRSTESTEPME